MRMKGFAGGSAVSQALMEAGHRSINIFPEPVPDRGPALLPAPGFVEFAPMPSGPGRGIAAEQNRLFGAYGPKLCEVDESGIATELGAIAVDQYPATFSSSGENRELFVVSGFTGYLVDLETNLMTTVVDDVRQGGHLDGFFLGLGDGIVKISEPDDGATWDPTQIFERGSESDPWIGFIIEGADIFLFGAKTGEVYYNRGSSPIPFRPRPGALFPVGLAAISSLAPFQGSVAWVGQTKNGGPRVYWMNGYTPNAISPPGLDWLLQTYVDGPGLDDAIGWSYDREGHEFYCVTFPGAGATWVFDGTTRQWHERLFWNTETGEWEEYRALFHAKVFNKNIVGDRAGSSLWAMRSDRYVDIGGSDLRRVRRMPMTDAENRRIRFPFAELECEVGVGIGYTGIASDPVVHLRYSNNRGKTWGMSRAKRVGKRGEFDLPRVRWNQCGSGRKRVWEVWSSDPVPTRWFDFHVEAK